MTLATAKIHPESALASLGGKVPAQAATKVNAAFARAADALTAGAAASKPKDTQVETQVRKWVGQTFYGTLLKQMRDSPFKSEMFDGGRGGEAFSQLFDQRIADHMTRGVGSKIVRPMVKKILSTPKEASLNYRKHKAATSAATQESSDVRTDRRA